VGAGRCRPLTWIADDEAGSDAVAVEDVGPLEAIDLEAAQARVEGDRVGETVLGPDRREQLHRLGSQGYSQAGLLVVRRQLDETERVARDEPAARRRRPGVDVRRERDVLGDRGAREALAGEFVDPALPVDLADLRGDARPELRAEEVDPGAAHPVDRRVRVRLAAPAAAADMALDDAVEPVVAQLLEARATRRELLEVVTSAP
jgi:hypothetical protein